MTHEAATASIRCVSAGGTEVKELESITAEVRFHHEYKAHMCKATESKIILSSVSKF